MLTSEMVTKCVEEMVEKLKEAGAGEIQSHTHFRVIMDSSDNPKDRKGFAVITLINDSSLY